MVGRAAAPLLRPLRASLRAALRLDSRPAGRFAPALNGPVPPHWPAGRGPRDSCCLRRGGFAAVPGSAPAARAWGPPARLRRLAPRFHRVGIGCAAVGFAAHHLPPRLAFGSPGFGRPDGLPYSHPRCGRLRLPSLGVRAVRIALVAALPSRCSLRPPPRNRGAKRRPCGPDARRAGLRPPARLCALGRAWLGALRLLATLRATGRLPPRQAVPPRGGRVLPGGGATVGFASLRLAPRSGLLGGRVAPSRIPGAAPCWLAFGSRYPRL